MGLDPEVPLVGGDGAPDGGAGSRRGLGTPGASSSLSQGRGFMPPCPCLLTLKVSAAPPVHGAWVSGSLSRR